MSRRFLRRAEALLVFLIAAALEIKFGPLGLGFENALLAALIALAVFLEFGELFFLSAFGFFLLSYKPAVSADVFLFAVLPFGAYAARRIFPWEPWLMNACFAAAGIFLFYFILEPSLAMANMGFLAREAAFGAIFGTAVFLTMRFSEERVVAD